MDLPEEETSVNCEIKSSPENREEKRKIKRTFVIFCVGIVLIFSGYTSVLVLQSSINIVGGLGAKVSAVNYATSMFFSIFVVPVVIRLVGAKISMILSEIAYITYVVANVYPTEWLLMIAAVIVGWAGATFWVPVGLLFPYYGHLYHKHSRKSEQACVREFSGIMFSMYQLNMIMGNLFVFVILHFLKSSDFQQHPDEHNHPDNVTTSGFLNYTENKTEVNLFSHCGANDCQDPENTQEHIGQYVPNPIAIYVLIFIFVAIMSAGCVIHILIMPDIPMTFITGKKDDDSDARVAQVKPKFTQILRESWIAVKDVFCRIIDLRQILLYPINIYLGLENAFLYSELSRAFASCIMGVSQVGLCSILYAITNSLTSYWVSKLMGRIGIMPVLTMVGLADMAVYTFIAAWVPTATTSWIVYLIFITLGSTSACWSLLVSNLYAETFRESRELSFTMWSCIFCVGVALQFAWSTLLCVRIKIYVQLATLVLSVFSVGILRLKIKQKENY